MPPPPIVPPDDERNDPLSPGAPAPAISGGHHPWGRVDFGVTGYGAVRRVRLTVFAPGTNTRERRLLRLWDAWPLITGAVAVPVLILLSAGPLILAAAVLAAVYGGGFWFLARATKTLRRSLRRVTVTSADVGGPRRQVGDISLFESSLSRLWALESSLRAGRIDPVGFEALWGEVYGLLPARGRLTR